MEKNFKTLFLDYYDPAFCFEHELWGTGVLFSSGPPRLTLTTHSSLRIGMLSRLMFLCQTQTVGCGAYMTRMRHHTKHEPAYYHVYTSCSCLCSGSWSCLHFTWWAWNPFKQGTSHLKIWICIYTFNTRMHLLFPTILETRCNPELAISNVDKCHVIKVSL